MATPHDIELGALRPINLALEGFGYPPIRQMPRGKPGSTTASAIYRALRPIGLGRAIEVGSKKLFHVNLLKARTLRGIWEELYPLRGHGVICTPTQVALPPGLMVFRSEFDLRRLRDLHLEEVLHPPSDTSLIVPPHPVPEHQA